MRPSIELSERAIPRWQMLLEEYRALHPEEAAAPNHMINALASDLERLRDKFDTAQNEAKRAELLQQIRGKEAEMESHVFQCIHSLKSGRTALCLSGGGIRSATFCLGAIQALAKLKLLTRFDYLSTVSGGGYVGSWLSAWAHRQEGGLEAVCQRIRGDVRDDDTDTECTAPSAEPRQVAHLREFSNYLTPRVGMMSTDAWAVAATYVRNLLVNWAVLLPLISAIVLVPWLYMGSVWFSADSMGPTTAGFLRVAGLAMFVMAYANAIMLQPSIMRCAPIQARLSAQDRPPLATRTRIILLVIVPLLVSSIFYSIRAAARARFP